LPTEVAVAGLKAQAKALLVLLPLKPEDKTKKDNINAKI
jgi:hypothetical protein